MLELSDVPNRHELADQLRQVAGLGGENSQAQQVPQLQEQLQQAGEIVQELQQQLQAAQQQLSDKSRELDLKERDLDIKETKVDSDARLAAEKLALEHVSQAQNEHEFTL